jgi:hypothetical protein
LLRLQRVVLGGWQDDDTYYIDVNILYLRRHAGIKRGAREGQLAVWDVKEHRAIRCNLPQKHE